MIRKSKKWVAAALLAIAAPSIFAAGDSPKVSQEAAMVQNIELFNSLYKELVSRYVDTVDTKKAITTAIDGLLYNLDPYTTFIPEEDTEDFESMTTGEYGGIGSVIMQSKTDGVVISEPYEGSPAALAGLRPGDRIIMVDGDSTVDWTTSKVSSRLKGLPNTTVKVVVDRPYVADSILTFSIVRKKVQLPSVPYYYMLDGGLGYIPLTTFNTSSPDEVRTALLELKKDKNLKAIVLDLADNGGGVMQSAIQIANLFVDKNTEIIRTKGRTANQEQIYKTTQKPVDTKIPLFVIISGGSASASEITAGAMQDLDRAVIVGQRSFGKGLVQTSVPLGNGDNLLKLTTQKYYLPSGRLIQAIDYSRRNEDGSVKPIPDSLTNVFYTRNHREVRDGGGIQPDIKLEQPELNRLIFNIVIDNWAFNFATKYASEHKTIPAAADFEITDTIFNEFKRFINPDKFNYDKVCETGLKQLRKTAETEGYMNDSTKVVFDQLEKLLKHDLYQDLDKNRKEISDVLAAELLKRYYFQQGNIVYRNKRSKEIEAIREVMAKPGEYERILSGKKEK